MADVTRTNLEEGVGERGDDVVVALDQGEALFTDTVSFFSLLNLVMVMMIKKMRVTMYHCKFSLSPQMPLYDFFDEPDPLGLSIFIHVPCLALGWSTWGPYDDILKILSPITCSLESSANRGLSCSARLSLWSCLYQFLSLPTSFPTPCVQTDTHVLNALFGWAMLVQNMPLGPLASPRSFKCFP